MFNEKQLINDVIVYGSIVAENGETVVLNPNEKIVDKITKRVKLNNGYCPCQVQRTKDLICPCKECTETGVCHCTL